MSIELVFLLVAVILFGLAAFGFGGWRRISYVPAGLFFFALTFLWPHLIVVLALR